MESQSRTRRPAPRVAGPGCAKADATPRSTLATEGIPTGSPPSTASRASSWSIGTGWSGVRPEGRDLRPVAGLETVEVMASPVRVEGLGDQLPSRFVLLHMV